MEKVSIIVPCYNGEEFVDRCINSIYQQSYPFIELIIVDDGSTDRSKERICEWIIPFQKKGYTLKYHYQKNKGVGSAINAGLKLVSGEYLSLLDADDEYLPEAVGERVQYLQQHKEIDVVRTNGWIVRPEHKFLFINDEEEKKRDDIFVALLKGETNNWAGSYMMRTKAVFRFYPEREIYQSPYGQNLQFLLPLLYKKNCGFIDKPHMNYIQKGNSLCRTDDELDMKKKSLKNIDGFRDIRIYMVEHIVDNVAERKICLDMIEAGYWKSVMNIAAMGNDKMLMKKAYRNKKKYEKISLNDKISYYGLIAPYKSYLYRVIRKMSYILIK